MFYVVNMSPEEFEAEKIHIKVFDANTFRRNELIGAYDVDFSFVHGQKMHEVYRRWCVLTDTEHSGDEIQGYLKVTCVVLGPGDAPPSHGGGDGGDDQADEDEAEISELVGRPLGATGGSVVRSGHE